MNSRMVRSAGLRLSSRQARWISALIDNDRKRYAQIIKDRKITVN